MKHPWSPQHFASEAAKAGRSASVISAALEAARRIKRRDPALPVIFTLAHLAHHTGVSSARLYEYIQQSGSDPYRLFRLKKRPKPSSRAPSRGHRTICVPQPDLMRVQRWIAQNILNTPAAAPHPASFAFYPGRDLRGAAERHASCAWLLKMDVRDFFDSISERKVYRVFRDLGYGALLSFQMARLCTRAELGRVNHYDDDNSLPHRTERMGRLPQGAPTSPGLANLAVKALDRDLEAIAHGLGWTYTRYADDVAFSTYGPSSRGEAGTLAVHIRKALNRHGLDANNAKTVIAPPGARKIVLGLLVDGPEPRLTRAFRNNLDTHLYAMNRHGVAAHQRARKFASTIGMRRHVTGLIAFAKHIEPDYASVCYEKLNLINWLS